MYPDFYPDSVLILCWLWTDYTIIVVGNCSRYPTFECSKKPKSGFRRRTSAPNRERTVVPRKQSLTAPKFQISPRLYRTGGKTQNFEKRRDFTLLGRIKRLESSLLDFCPKKIIDCPKNKPNNSKPLFNILPYCCLYNKSLKSPFFEQKP